MFIKTIKVKKPTFAVIGAVLAALALLAVIIVTVVRISSPAVYEMKSEAQRQAFLKEMGWEVSDEYDECKAVTIPKEFNEVYEKYNKLQKQQGFDLEDYKGKTAEVYRIMGIRSRRSGLILSSVRDSLWEETYAQRSWTDLCRG